jgi:hypothetical protein
MIDGLTSWTSWTTSDKASQARRQTLLVDVDYGRKATSHKATFGSSRSHASPLMGDRIRRGAADVSSWRSLLLANTRCDASVRSRPALSRAVLRYEGKEPSGLRCDGVLRLVSKAQLSRCPSRLIKQKYLETAAQPVNASVSGRHRRWG